jgi:6-carboxyhexanoate--CoA ligase
MGGKNGVGGKHISGAERIVEERDVEKTVAALLERARSHQRGRADFINLKIQEIDEENAARVPLLKIYSHKSSTKDEGRAFARRELLRIGVAPLAVENAFSALESLPDSMRGAMIFDSVTGIRLDSFGERGVRCSNMDVSDKAKYESQLSSINMAGEHAREALVLASKVASAAGTVAELCWSDDPDYVTGYVASPKFGYCRISVMKDLGDFVGGRVFFVDSKVDLENYIDYLQNKVVLVES